MPEYKNGVIVGGGEASYTDSFWNPSTPPPAANALDDEFDSGSLTDWNDYDFGSVGVNAVNADINKLTITLTKGAAGEENTGLYRDAPRIVGDYSYTTWARVSVSTEDLTDFPVVSLVAGVDMSLAVSTVYVLALIRASSAWNVVVFRNSAWNVYYGQIGAAEAVESTHVYLRQRVRYIHSTTTTSIFFDYSSDGVGWKAMLGGTSADLSGEIESIGLSINDSAATSGDKTVGYFDFFRVYDGFAFDTIPQGRLVKGVLP